MSEIKHKKLCRFCLSKTEPFAYLFGGSDDEASWQIKAIQVLSLEVSFDLWEIGGLCGLLLENFTSFLLREN
jgi:hypothetical protein